MLWRKLRLVPSIVYHARTDLGSIKVNDLSIGFQVRGGRLEPDHWQLTTPVFATVTIPVSSRSTLRAQGTYEMYALNRAYPRWSINATGAFVTPINTQQNLTTLAGISHEVIGSREHISLLNTGLRWQ